MKSVKNGVCKISILMVVLGALAGCYESDKPVLQAGERSALAGRFECTNAIDGSKELRTISEQRDGIWPFANYRYVDAKGVFSLLTKLGNGLVLAQSTKQNGGYQYAFLEFVNDKSFMLMSPDLMSKGPFVEALAKKSSVILKHKGEVVLLIGTQQSMMQFLRAHDRSIMMVVQKCDRVPGMGKPNRSGARRQAQR